MQEISKYVWIKSMSCCYYSLNFSLRECYHKCSLKLAWCNSTIATLSLQRPSIVNTWMSRKFKFSTYMTATFSSFSFCWRSASSNIFLLFFHFKIFGCILFTFLIESPIEFFRHLITIESEIDQPSFISFCKCSLTSFAVKLSYLFVFL